MEDLPKEKLDEHTLIQRVQQGEKEAFRPLVSLNKDRVFNLILRSVRDFQLAEELAQDVFIRAYRGIASFRFDSSFNTWITKIALNVVSSYKVSKTHKERQQSSPYEDVFLGSAGSAEDEVLLKERLDSFYLCYEKLSEKLQQVVLLVGLQGLSYEESGEALSIPTGTIRSRLNQARLLLLHCMKRKEGESV